MGDAQSYEHRGVAPRAISQLFGEVNSRIEFEFKVSCSYMEIYNEKIYDLLGDLANPDMATDYTIAEDKEGRGTFVRGIAEIEVKDEAHALSLLFSGGLSRTVSTHKLNKRSNRSHSIFTMYVQQRQRSGVSERVVHSKLHLVDLAGSERLKKTMDSIDGAMGDEVTRKESMAINQSLTYLEQCVIALARRNPGHVPYRQSKLTNILKDCLGANCNTVMIACMWGENTHLEETVSTLRLASRMMRVQNETSAVETIDPMALIKKQEKIIRALKQELHMHDALVQRTGVTYESYTPEQQASLAQMIERYVDAPEVEEENVLNITNYRQMLEICKQFKRKLLSARSDAKIAQEQQFLGVGSGLNASRAGRGMDATSGGSGFDTSDFAADSKLAGDYDPNAPTVGESAADSKSGFGLGVAATDSRPLNGIERAQHKYDHKPGSPGNRDGPSVSFGIDTTGGGSPSPYKTQQSPSKSIDFSDPSLGGENIQAFELFIRGEGRSTYQDFTHAKEQIKDNKKKSKDITMAVNQAKQIIDQLQAEVESRKASRLELMRRPGTTKLSAKEDLVDEEEFRLTNELKDAKRTYKKCFEQMQQYKQGVVENTQRAAKLRLALANAFNQWNELHKSAPGSPQKTGAFSPAGKTAGGGGTFGDTMEGTTPGGPESTGGGGGDQLDDQEAFDKLELERVLANDPDSLAFFNAQKTRRANVTQSGGTIRQILKNKRFV